VLVGSSIMESTPHSVIAAACGGSAVNLSMPAMSASEQRLMLDAAFAHRALRRAIVVLDFNAFAGAPDARQDVAGPLPRYLFDRNPFNDLPYLLSGNVLVKAWRILRDDPGGESFTSNPDAPWFWGDRKRFARDEALKGLDLQDLNRRYQQPSRTLDGMRASFAHNLAPLLRAHPETEFDLVWPPYSILVWLDFAQRDQLDVTLAFKRHVFEATRGLPNARVVDLQSEAAVTHDLDRYTDLYHFAPDVNAWLVRETCAHGHAVDATTVDSFEHALRAQVRAVQTPDGLERVVGNGR